jgi:hypothetical protein
VFRPGLTANKFEKIKAAASRMRQPRRCSACGHRDTSHDLTGVEFGPHLLFPCDIVGCTCLDLHGKHLRTKASTIGGTGGEKDDTNVGVR